MQQKVWRVVIRIKKSDELYGKSVTKLVLDLLMANKIWGATIWTGVDGFGKRHKSVKRIEGVVFDSPVVIEVIEEKERLEPLLTEIRKLVGDNGLVTRQEVGVV